MSKALSVDLQERVVAAIAAGASCRAAAARFGVSSPSAIRWATLAREAGSVAPGPLGGDRRTARIEAHAPLILGLVERPPTSLSRRSRPSWPRRVCPLASARCGASSTGAG
jgi:transposase